MRLKNYSPFKVGDRVIYLPWQDNTTCVITKIQNGLIHFRLDSGAGSRHEMRDMFTYFRKVGES